MTVWQSIALISPWQAAYAVGLVVLFGLRGTSFIAWLLLADFIALLLIAGAMDLGLLSHAPGDDQVFGAVMVVWCVATVALAVHPQGSLLMASFSAVGVAIMLFSLRFGVKPDTTSAIVNTLAFVQLAVAAIGTGDGGGVGRRDADRAVSLAPSGVYSGTGAGGLATRPSLLSQSGGDVE